MTRQTSLTLAALAVLAVAPAALEAQKARRPIDTRGAMPADVTSGFGRNNNDDIRVVTIGSRMSSSLDDADRALNSGHKVELWAMELRQDEQVEVTLRSGSFDTRLAVFDPDNTSNSAENDDFEASSTNSQVAFRAGKTGVFGILITSFDTAERGAYTLEVVRVGGEQLALTRSAVKIFPMSKLSR